MLACPLCRRPLAPVDDGLRCPTDAATFAAHPSGLFDLRPVNIRENADAFAADYAAARRANGWQPLSPEIASALPYGDPPGFTRLYWAVRRESWAALAALLADLTPPSLVIADVGAGFAWLSHRLASLGHRVIAIDLSANPDFGLGAAQLYPTALQFGGRTGSLAGSFLQPGQFLPILGDLEHPPLAPRAYDAAICNASLHYVGSLPAAITNLAETLRPGGKLIVLDSPVSDDPRASDCPGGRALGRAELQDAMHAAGLSVAWLLVSRGCLWQRHQLKNRLMRRPGFELPLVAGRKPDDRESASADEPADSRIR